MKNRTNSASYCHRKGREVSLAGILILLLAVCSSITNAESTTSYSAMSVSSLTIAASKYDANAIVELGKRKAQSAIPLLLQIAAEQDFPPHPMKGRPSDAEWREASHRSRANASHLSAKIALAQMGNESYFHEFVVGISSTNPEYREQSIFRLAEVGDKKAVKYLIPLLSDTSVRPGHGDDDAPSRFDHMAADALRMILPDVWAQFFRDAPGGRFYPVPTWKAWWKDHHAEYENLK